jgi:hypothetical protein
MFSTCFDCSVLIVYIATCFINPKSLNDFFRSVNSGVACLLSVGGSIFTKTIICSD